MMSVYDDIRRDAACWSLAGDASIRGIMEVFAEKLQTRAKELENELSHLEANVDSTAVKLGNVRNAFLLLSHRKFVESRLSEDDDTQENDTNVSANSPKEKLFLEHARTALRTGIDFMQTLNVPKLEDDFVNRRVTCRHYTSRRLPPIIGSPSFLNNDNWGTGGDGDPLFLGKLTPDQDYDEVNVTYVEQDVVSEKCQKNFVKENAANPVFSEDRAFLSSSNSTSFPESAEMAQDSGSMLSENKNVEEKAKVRSGLVNLFGSDSGADNGDDIMGKHKSYFDHSSNFLSQLSEKIGSIPPKPTTNSTPSGGLPESLKPNPPPRSPAKPSLFDAFSSDEDDLFSKKIATLAPPKMTVSLPVTTPQVTQTAGISSPLREKKPQDSEDEVSTPSDDDLFSTDRLFKTVNRNTLFDDTDSDSEESVPFRQINKTGNNDEKKYSALENALHSSAIFQSRRTNEERHQPLSTDEKISFDPPISVSPSSSVVANEKSWPKILDVSAVKNRCKGPKNRRLPTSQWSVKATIKGKNQNQVAPSNLVALDISHSPPPMPSLIETDSDDHLFGNYSSDDDVLFPEKM